MLSPRQSQIFCEVWRATLRDNASDTLFVQENLFFNVLYTLLTPQIWWENE